MNEEPSSINDLEGIIASLNGGLDPSMKRDRPYIGQSHTYTGERGKTEIRGITFRDLRDCFIRAVLLSAPGLPALSGEASRGENARLCTNDLYGWDLDDLDPGAVSQNLSCEVEKIMGIYPNLPRLLSDELKGGAE